MIVFTLTHTILDKKLGLSSIRYGAVQENFGIEEGLVEEEFGDENADEDEDDDKNYECDEEQELGDDTYESIKDGEREEVEECGNESEEEDGQGYVGVKAPLVGTNSTRSEMSLTEMSINMTNQAFG